MNTTVRVEFPDFPVDAIPALPEGFEDSSWHNDAAPSYICETLRLQAFFDFPNDADREMPGGKRYYLQTFALDMICETDDWAHVLEKIAVCRAEHEAKFQAFRDQRGIGLSERGPCFSYCEGQLSIDIVLAAWPPGIRKQGAFCLTIANIATVSDNLADLERKLFGWALSEEIVK